MTLWKLRDKPPFYRGGRSMPNRLNRIRNRSKSRSREAAGVYGLDRGDCRWLSLLLSNRGLKRSGCDPVLGFSPFGKEAVPVQPEADWLPPDVEAMV